MGYIGSAPLPTQWGGTDTAGYFDGQLLIGDTSTNSLLVNTLIAGPGITVTNGSGTIEISASGAVLNTATLTTNNGVTQPIVGIVVAQHSSIVLTGTIIGSKSDYSQTVGGNFTVVAGRETGMNIYLVGGPFVNATSTSAATFTCGIDVGTQQVQVQVTGVNPDTYNWICTYSFTVENA